MSPHLFLSYLWKTHWTLSQFLTRNWFHHSPSEVVNFHAFLTAKWFHFQSFVELRCLVGLVDQVSAGAILVS